MGSVAASKLVRPTPARQEQVDISHLYQLLHYYKHCCGKRIKVEAPDDLPLAKKYEKVHTEVTHQVECLLADLHELVQSKHSKDSSEKWQLSRYHFNLVIKKSSVKHPEAGKGVFLQGYAAPGTVLMFHPGLVYMPLDIRKMPNYPQIDKNNMYLMSRYDGCILDAKDYDTNIQVLPNNNQQCTKKCFMSHPFAQGHMVNHPSPGSEPNIMPFSYDVLDSFPKHLLHLIPNRYFRKPGILHQTPAVMRSVVFIATKHIENEELFVNYRLNPARELPSWYSPVDVQEDLRRWKV